jgi:hypothetical protein
LIFKDGWAHSMHSRWAISWLIWMGWWEDSLTDHFLWWVSQIDFATFWMCDFCLRIESTVSLVWRTAGFPLLGSIQCRNRQPNCFWWLTQTPRRSQNTPCIKIPREKNKQGEGYDDEWFTLDSLSIHCHQSQHIFIFVSSCLIIVTTWSYRKWNHHP